MFYKGRCRQFCEGGDTAGEMKGGELQGNKKPIPCITIPNRVGNDETSYNHSVIPTQVGILMRLQGKAIPFITISWYDEALRSL